ncbi:MAG: hypothetical protein GY950_29715, partial [bacterium]|nr:hypothetical protein [bacterium]
MDSLKQKDIILPLIPLRELVAFPSAIIPVLVGRERSINALRHSRERCNNYVFLCVQKNQISESPAAVEIADIGIIARVEKSAEQNNGSFRVIIQGLERAVIREFVKDGDHFQVKVSVLEEVIEKNRKYTDLSRDLISIFEEYVNLKKVRLHGIVAKLESNQVSEIADIVASVINIPISIKQTLLEELNVYNRAVKVFNILKKEVFRLKAERGINEPRRGKDEPAENDIEEYKRKIEAAGLPEYVQKRAREELERLEMMPPFSAESTVSRYYLDWLLAVPWLAVKEENK